LWRPRSPGPTASFRNSGAFFGAFVGSIGGHATAGAYAHAFQRSLAINALLVLARHRFKRAAGASSAICTAPRRPPALKIPNA